ncbi:elongator complex protein 3 [Dethiothermospora halolimnae]|uniref:elongator complex protein 3 n=1 Tax=Dethiothermospora halolimnae TaxID=3114390 RepID=UPI003CCBB150
MSKTYHIIPIFVPHRGCPHDCVFCNQRKITGLSTEITDKDVDDTIKEYLKTIPKSNKKLEVAFFGGSFTGIDIKVQKELLDVAKEYKEKGLIDNIRLSTRPDYIDKEILDILKGKKVDTIELGVQSLDKDVLEKSNRGHTMEDVINASNLIKRYGFNLGLQMMVGLPGDTVEKSINTAKQIISLSPDFVRIYPTLVVKDTHLENMYLDRNYKSLTLEEGVFVSSILLMLFKVNDIGVIRIGLQPTDNISLNKDLVAGPFHPSFRQMVESELYRIVIDKFMSENTITNDIIIEVNNSIVSNIIGQKKKNKSYLKKKYNIKNFKINGTNIPRDYMAFYNNNKYNKININKYIYDYLKEKNII